MFKNSRIKMRAQNPGVKGFTLIEILVVILIIGILAAYFGQNIFGQTNDAKINVAETQLATQFPAALVGYHSTNGYDAVDSDGTTPITKDDLVKRGVKPQTPWGENWTIDSQTTTQNDNSITIDYPTGDSNAQDNANAILAKLGSGSDGGAGGQDYPMITKIQTSASNVAVTYHVN